MKKSVKKKIEAVLKDHFDKEHVTVTKGMLRAAKKVYQKIPRTKRHLVG